MSLYSKNKDFTKSSHNHSINAHKQQIAELVKQMQSMIEWLVDLEQDSECEN